MIDQEDDDAVHIPIDGVLDLHHFSPKDLKTLIPDYISECRSLNILEIRLIHGKGVGNIRRAVHSLLDRNKDVISYSLAGSDAGGWGATIVHLLPGDQS